MRLRPPDPRTELVARVWLQGRLLFVALGNGEKDAALRDVVKACGFQFDYDRTAWRRILLDRHGSPDDRAAETAHRLLAARFQVEVADDIALMVARASYEPEITRWILACETVKYRGWLLLEWSRDDDCYNAARSIPGNRYDPELHRVVVPPEQYEMARDFAKLFDFAISEEAEIIMEAAEKRRLAALIIEVPPLPAKGARPIFHLPEVPEGIDPALTDD